MQDKKFCGLDEITERKILLSVESKSSSEEYFPTARIYVKYL